MKPSLCLVLTAAPHGVDAVIVTVVISEEEGRRDKIAFNSLYLFSSKSINYEANGENCIITRVESPSAPLP